MATFTFVREELQKIQNNICGELSEAAGQTFQEDTWKYEHGTGGGITRITQNNENLTHGQLEKCGVNFSGIEGKLNPVIAEKMGMEPASFKATGVSLVVHPLNPYIPTTHANIRYFETAEKWWVGGGIDLTPYYFFHDDVIHFHSVLKTVCDQHDVSYYPKFKKECDEYFYIKHRDETRGVGGIFFDYLNQDKDANLAFIFDVGRAFIDAYLPILNKRKKLTYTEKEREFQLIRRGRYVEFNLVYDRGTLFGFQTNGRVESILMSLPTTAKWVYNYTPDKNSKEYEIYQYLKPVNWLGI